MIRYKLLFTFSEPGGIFADLHLLGNLPKLRDILNIVHGPIVILVPTRRTKDDCCELIAHKVEIESLYDNLSVGVAFRVFFPCKSAGNDL